MLELPKNIDEKIQKLPVISFGDSEAFQQVLFSDDFTDIFNYYRLNYLPDVLKSKPEIEQKISLYLSLTNQDDSFIEQTDQILYKRPVPDIQSFLNDRFYMYYSNATLYPYWKDKLETIFAKGSPVRKVIFSGCIGCLTGDTQVATLNGNKTMKELVANHKNEWVLSVNTSTKEWEPDKIIDAFSTGVKDIYEITLDSGDIIRCTANHLFLTRKNKWKSIDTGLTPGMSMMPYYEQISKTGYTQVKNNNTEKFENRYSIVGKWKSRVCKGIAIHHKNFNKLDDRPENLCMLPYKLHTQYHQKKGGDRWREYNASIRGDEYKEYRSLKSKKGKETYKQRKDYAKLERKRMKAWNALLQDSERQSQIAKSTWERFPEKMKKIAQSTITARNKTEKARNTSRKMAENMRNLLKTKTSEELLIINLKKGLPSLKKFHGVTSEVYKKALAKIREKEPWYNPELGAKANYKLKSKYNHKIVSIKYIGKEEVFDLTTERNHNFALTAGIVAHNSGKSTIARKAFIYTLYRILCLRYPRAAFNIDGDSTIANIVISMTLKQVYDTNLLPFVKLMESMPCFQHVMSARAFENFDLTNPRCPFPYYVEKSSGTIFFPDNIIITCGSGQQHFTGYNVVNSFCLTGDTKVVTNYGTKKIKDLEKFIKNRKVYTYSLNEHNELEQSQIIAAKQTNVVNELMRLWIDDDFYVECTLNHKIPIKNPNSLDKNIEYIHGLAYKQAQYLTEEDEVYNFDLSYNYALVDPINNKPFYIGVGEIALPLLENEKKYERAYSHYTTKIINKEKKTNPHLANKISILKQYGFTPKVIILNENITKEQAYKNEITYINKYKTIKEGGILVNISLGGQGCKHTAEMSKRVSESNKKTKALKKEQKLQKIRNKVNKYFWLLIILCNTTAILYKQQIHLKRCEAVKKSIEKGTHCNWAIKNSTKQHREMVAYYNHLHPKVSSKESKEKLAKSQSITWNKKSIKEKELNNIAKSLGRAWNVLKRIDGNIINEKIFNAHRSKGSRLANTEPMWQSIIKKCGGINQFLKQVKNRYGKEFVYEI